MKKTKTIGDFKVDLIYTKPSLTNSGKSKIVITQKKQKGTIGNPYKKVKEYQTAQTGYERYTLITKPSDVYRL